MFKSSYLYGSPENEQKYHDDGSLISLENETGTGKISVYRLFSGMDLIYNDIHMAYCRKNPICVSNVLEINYCREGRCECSFKAENYCYMTAGDLSLCMLEKGTHRSVFPTSHYHGMTLTIDFDKLTEEFHSLCRVFPIDLKAILLRVSGRLFYIVNANDSIRHIFAELYQLQKTGFRVDLARVKIMELLLLLSDLPVEAQPERRYFSGNQIACVKNVRRHMIDNLNMHETIEELAERFGISPTALKQCFRAIYGASIYAYLKTYRLQYSEKLLREGKLSVSEIAGLIGYSNPNKFSSAFRKVYGMSPTQFQKNV